MSRKADPSYLTDAEWTKLKPLSPPENHIRSPREIELPSCQEAWLLFDEKALRRAAGNLNGCQQLDLPDIAKLEELPHPKNDLYELLRQASELSLRRLKKFSVNKFVYRVAELIDDFTLLRSLAAFMTLEAEIEQVIKQGWCSK